MIDLCARLMWDSEEEDEMRKGRGCMLHYQSSPLKVLTHFTAQMDPQRPADPLTGDMSVKYFLGPDWQVNHDPSLLRAPQGQKVKLGLVTDLCSP